jgi:hypothetical protein
MNIETHKDSKLKTTALDMWFETTIQELRDDYQAIKLGTAPKEKEDFYNKLINIDNDDELSNELKERISVKFLKKALQAYGTQITSSKHRPLQIALNHSDNKLLVFAIIEDGDEDTENMLLAVAAEINYKFERYGIRVSTMIIEESDNYPVPKHYMPLF